MRTPHSTILCLIFLTVPALAEKNADIKPVLATPESMALQDAFDRAQPGDKWSFAKGEWKIVEGALTGKELAADKHAAVATLKHPNTDSVVKMSFKLAGTDGFMFSLNHAKGHLFRVVVMKDRLIVRTDKDKKDPKSKSETIGSTKADFSQDAWHTLLVEMKGDTVAVTADNGASLQGKHPRLDTQKPGYRLVMKGESLIVDDISVWDLAN